MAGVHSQINGLKSQVMGLNSSTVKAQGAFSGLATAAKLFLGAAVVRAMYQVGKSSLTMANEVVESENLFAESMKGMSGEARIWSDGLRDSLGLNAFTMRKNVGTFNVMFKSMGLTTDKAYEMATGITVLAEDMASFYNLKSEEAFDKLRAGITGETEPLKRLGILVDENTVKQYAMREGISTTGKELTQQEKLLARYAAIMAQTSTAQGDLARTISSPVNQIRVLNNTLDQARVALGQSFQPLQAAILPVLNSIASAALFAARAVSAFVNAISRLSTVNIFAGLTAGKSAKKQGELAESLDKTSEAMKGGGGAAKQAAKDAKQAAKDAKVGLKAFDEINQLTKETAENIKEGGGGGGGGGMDEVEVPDTDEADAYADALEAISQKVRDAAAAIKAFWDGLKDSLIAKVVGGAWETLKWIFESVLKPMGEWALNNPRAIGDAIGAIAIAVGGFKVAKGVVTFLRNMSGAIKGIGDASLAFPGLAGWVHKIGTAVKAFPTIGIAVGVVAGVALIANAIYENSEKLKENDLAERFGDVAYSMEELKTIAGLVSTPFVDAMNQMEAEYASLQQIADSLKQLSADASKIIFGYSLQPAPLTEEQKALLQTTIQGLVDSAISGVNASKVTSLQAIQIAFGQDSKVFEISSDNWSVIEAQAQALGAELSAMVAEALLDDDITPEEQIAIEKHKAKLMKLAIQATDIDAALAEIEMSNILIGFKGEPTLTAESTKDFSDALNQQLEKQIASIDVSMEKLLALDIAIARKAGEIEGLSPEEIQGEVDTLIAAANAQKQVHVLDAQLAIGEVYFEGVVSQITAAYSKELTNVQPLTDALATDWIAEAAKKLFGDDWQTELEKASPTVKDEIALEASMMLVEATEGIDVPTAAAQKNARDLLEAMKPTTSQWKKMADDFTKQGKELPKWLADGLSAVESLEMVASASKKMDEAASQVLSVADVDKYLSEGKHRGDRFAKGLETGKSPAQSAASAVAQAARNGLSGGDTYGLGVDFASGFSKGIRSKVSDVIRAGEVLTTAAKKAMQNNAMIQSPSKVTTELGQFFGDGFVVGMANMKDKIYNTSASLSQAAISGMSGVNSAFGADINGSMEVGDGGISGAIARGVEQGVQRVMSALTINLSVDGEQFGRVSIRSINETQRRAGQYLLGMG